MDDESIEPMEEVPLKELGESESGAFRGIGLPDDTDCVFRISGREKLRMLLVNRVLKTNTFRECALKIALTRSTFQPKNAVNRRGSKILQGRVSNPSERGTAPIILTHVTGTKQFLALEEIVGARRSYDI